MSSKKTATYGLLIALAFIFSYVESLVPIPLPIPGMKLGLANIVVLIALYVLGSKQAFGLSVLRIVLVGLTFGSLFSMIYSLAGGILSCIAMILCKKTKLFSIVGVSIVGGVTHNIGQIIAAILIVENRGIAYYLPVLLVTGAVTGLLIGMLGAEITKRLTVKLNINNHKCN
ncbi:MAG: putative rane protein [Clostridiales bacterium]|jgi:heptaprenyl diphosphate synthase|nr:putative rane protein [Clostridiales bacterium]